MNNEPEGGSAWEEELRKGRKGRRKAGREWRLEGAEANGVKGGRAGRLSGNERKPPSQVSLISFSAL